MSKDALRRNQAMKGHSVKSQQNRLTDAPKPPGLVRASQPSHK